MRAPKERERHAQQCSSSTAQRKRGRARSSPRVHGLRSSVVRLQRRAPAARRSREHAASWCRRSSTVAWQRRTAGRTAAGGGRGNGARQAAASAARRRGSMAARQHGSQQLGSRSTCTTPKCACDSVTHGAAQRRDVCAGSAAQAWRGEKRQRVAPRRCAWQVRVGSEARARAAARPRGHRYRPTERAQAHDPSSARRKHPGSGNGGKEQSRICAPRRSAARGRVEDAGAGGEDAHGGQDTHASSSTATAGCCSARKTGSGCWPGPNNIHSIQGERSGGAARSAPDTKRLGPFTAAAHGGRGGGPAAGERPRP